MLILLPMALLAGPVAMASPDGEGEDGQGVMTAPAVSISPLVVLASLSWEPDCKEVLQVALEVLMPPEGLVPSAKRIRLAALLPRVRVSLEKNFEHDESLDKDDEGSIEIGVDTDDDLEIRAYVQWDLSKLVFHGAENTAFEKRVKEKKLRMEVIEQVVSVYHERKKLLVLLGMNASTDPVDLLQILIRCEELTAFLDAATGNWFSQELARRKSEGALPTSWASSP